jgi:hypothetical protein
MAGMDQNSNALPVRGVVALEKMSGGDEKDKRLLQTMAQNAQGYIESYSWCKSIREIFFGNGVGGVVAVFFIRIEPSRSDVDEWLWVVVGDLPTAYLVIDDSDTPSQALESYIWEMSKWVKLAKRSRSSRRVISVNTPSTPENAEALDGRLRFLREVIVPKFRSNETARP